jgi:hypothetical protein
MDIITKVEHGWESVGELKDTEGRNKRCQSEKVGNRSGNNERETPIDGNCDNPDDLASSRCQRWRSEEVNEDIVV